MEPDSDFYQVLGVSRDVDAVGIKSAFRKLAKLYHPDKNTADPGASEKFRKITEAYQVLMDPLQRESYDFQANGDAFAEETAAYLHVTINHSKVRLNEEVELTYSYAGEGRFFQRSEMVGWVITSGPLVDHRIVEFEGRPVKETVLNYTVCPVKTGILEIPPAKIKIQRQQFSTVTEFIEVTDNACYFKKEALAGSRPVVINLHKERVTSSSIYRKTIVHRRRILIPRSDIAWWYHRVGKIIKVSWIVCVTAWTLAHGFGVLLGILAGAFAGGIICHIMYRLVKMRSIFYNAAYHPLVNEYLRQGYEFGKEPSYSLIGKRRWQLVKGLFS
jgi:hypothetical protein